MSWSCLPKLMRLWIGSCVLVVSFCIGVFEFKLMESRVGVALLLLLRKQAAYWWQ